MINYLRGEREECGIKKSHARKIIFAYGQPEENNGYLLWQVSMRWQLLMNQQLRTVGITLKQFSLLAGLYWLDRQQKVVTQQKLVDYANSDKMMTSKVLQTLENKGLLLRLDNPQDGRAKRIRLTPQGETLLGQANALVEQVDAEFFTPIRTEGTVFNRLMQQLASQASE